MKNEAQLEELDRRRRLQEVELEVSRSLLRTEDRDPVQVLTTVFRSVAEVLKVDAVTLLGIDDETVSVAASWSRPAGNATLAGSQIPRSLLPDVQELTASAKIVRIGVGGLPAPIVERLNRRGFGDAEIVGVPLIADDTVVGALAVICDPGLAHTTDEVEFMESVAGSAWGFLVRHRTEADLAQRVAEAELLARVSAMIAEPGPSIERELVAAILEQLGDHVGAVAVGLFERDGDTARLFAEWNPRSIVSFRPIQLDSAYWENLEPGTRASVDGTEWSVYPAIHRGDVIGKLVVAGDDERPANQDRVVAGTIELLRQLRIRALSERELERKRRMEDLRSTIAASYVRAEHWQVVETTALAIERIGRIMRASVAHWIGRGLVDEPVTRRIWTLDDTPPPADLPVPAGVEDLLDDPEARVIHTTDRSVPDRRPSGAETPGADKLVVVPAVTHDRVEATLVLVVPGGKKVTANDLAVLSDIACMIQEMEQWADVEAQTEIRRVQLEYQATHDDLTGLGNRRLLLEALAESMRTGPVAVLMIDMDRFKVVNDTLGHTAGDTVLTTIADRLRLAVREPDLTCRLGGDEFTVMVPEGGDHAQLAALANRLIDVVREPVTVRGTTVTPTCSIGIAASAAGDRVEGLLQNADTALHEAKRLGRDRYEFCDDDHRDSLRDRLQLETSLRQGLRHGQFTTWYQPEVDLLTREVIGVEALIRWNHPSDGVVPASAFIDVAEDVGLAPEMSRIALLESCRDLADWQRNGLSTRVRVNVASAQLQTRDLDEIIGGMLDRHGLEADRLCVEITERSLMLDLQSTASTLRELRRMGVEVAIDDFGTGFSSLARLRGLPVDTLKIDRSFVSGIVKSDTDRDIIRTILGLADAVGLDVVAEGVEHEAQARILTELGCRRAQGWLWSKAVPAEAIRPLLASSRSRVGPEWQPTTGPVTSSGPLS